MIRRGAVVWVNFGSPRGLEPAKTRPAIVLQDNWLDDSAINTVIVIPLTSNISHQRFPGNVFISSAASGLERDSVALVTQVGAVSKEFLEPHAVSELPRFLFSQVCEGVRLAMGL